MIAVKPVLSTTTNKRTLPWLHWHSYTGLAVVYFLIINAALCMLIYSQGNHMSHALHMSHSDIATMLTRQRGSTASNALTTLTDTMSTHAARLQNKACQIHADIVLAVVPTPMPQQSKQTTLYAASHDRYVRLLQQILKVMNTAHGRSVYLAIILDVDTLHPAHRQWCHSISWCHLHLVSNASHPTQVIDTMHSLQVCTPNYLLMPDYVHIDAAFLLRLKMLPSERVACLVRDVRNAAQDACKSNAFQLPSSFALSSTNSEQYAIVSSALKQDLYAGNFDVVSVH